MQHDWGCCAGLAHESAINAGFLQPGQFVTDVNSQPRPMSRAAMVLAAGFVLTLFGGGSRFVIGLVLKPVVDELCWPRSYLGIAVGLYFVVTAVCTFYAGKLADRVSFRILFGAGLAVSGVGVGLMGFMTEPWHALVLYGVIFAIGNGAVSTPPVGVMVTRAFPGRTGLANSLVLSGMTIGQLVMVAILSLVLVAIGWRSVFFWIGLAHAALLIVVLPAIPAKPTAQAIAAAPRREGMTLKQAMQTRQFWMLCVIFAVCGLDDFFVTTHVVAFAQDRGVVPLIAGYLFAVMGLTGFVGVISAGLWGDRAGPVWPTAAAFAVRIAVFALIVVDQSPLSITIFCLAFGLTFLVTAPLTVLFVRDAFGMANLGAISGVITMVHMVFGGIGAYAGAAIFDRSGRYDLAFVIVLVATVVALVLMMCLDRGHAVRPAS